MAEEKHEEDTPETGPRDSTEKATFKTATETSPGAASPPDDTPDDTTGEALGEDTGTGQYGATQEAPTPERTEDSPPADTVQTAETAPPESVGGAPADPPETAPEDTPDALSDADSSAGPGTDPDTDPASADPPSEPPTPTEDDLWTAGEDARDHTALEPEPQPTPETEPAPASAPMSPMSQPDAPAQPCAAGLFGKLPARGDFISRAIDRDLLRPLEDWLLPLVQTARGLLGDGWSAAWHHAPAWRFWIGPDILQGDWKRSMRTHDRPGAVTGVLLPSADRQGRHFPLVLVLADEHARLMPPPVLSPPDRQWYAHCDRLLEAARGGRDLAEVETELSTLRAPHLPEGAAEMRPLLAQQSLWGQGGMQAGGDVWTDIRMSDHHLAAACRSYWWTEAPGMTEGVAPPISVISLAGLPDAETFAFMLTDAIPQPQEPDPT